jgi:hypothetical protein
MPQSCSEVSFAAYGLALVLQLRPTRFRYHILFVVNKVRG